MKEQPVGVGRDPIDHSVGQRPIHETYEPPDPIPQFRPRPKLQQAQPSPTKVPTKRPRVPTITTKRTQAASPEATKGSQAADSKKSD